MAFFSSDEPAGRVLDYFLFVQMPQVFCAVTETVYIFFSSSRVHLGWVSKSLCTAGIPPSRESLDACTEYVRSGPGSWAIL